MVIYTKLHEKIIADIIVSLKRQTNWKFVRILLTLARKTYAETLFIACSFYEECI